MEPSNDPTMHLLETPCLQLMDPSSVGDTPRTALHALDHEPLPDNHWPLLVKTGSAPPLPGRNNAAGRFPRNADLPFPPIYLFYPGFKRTKNARETQDLCGSRTLFPSAFRCPESTRPGEDAPPKYSYCSSGYNEYTLPPYTSSAPRVLEPPGDPFYTGNQKGAGAAFRPLPSGLLPSRLFHGSRARNPANARSVSSVVPSKRARCALDPDDDAGHLRRSTMWNRGEREFTARRKTRAGSAETFCEVADVACTPRRSPESFWSGIRHNLSGMDRSAKLAEPPEFRWGADTAPAAR
ncbi:hypothetical protein DFH07DRAFT_67680 [Mycena maculata]|uniref:Uncharacterized protein n=1 Tax=Mycena maculata TaxID=230809 RepID=A0AAD7IEY6_9AGAR|nr:hypothetical protein DFH07DRAFT_67680 [Mycena maculata]